MFETKEEMVKACLSDIQMLKQQHMEIVIDAIQKFEDLLDETIERYKVLIDCMEDESLPNNEETITA